MLLSSGHLHSVFVASPFSVPTLALRGRHSRTHLTHEETEASAGKVPCPGTFTEMGHSPFPPPQPPVEPRTDSTVSRDYQEGENRPNCQHQSWWAERRTGRCPEYIPGPPTCYLLWGSPKPQEASHRGPQFTGEGVLSGT